MHLAVFRRDRCGDLIGVFLEQLPEPEEDARALCRRRVAPRRESRLGRGNGIFHRRFGRHGDMLCELARRRVVDRLGTIVVGDIGTIDEVTKQAGCVDVARRCCVHYVFLTLIRRRRARDAA